MVAKIPAGLPRPKNRMPGSRYTKLGIVCMASSTGRRNVVDPGIPGTHHSGRESNQDRYGHGHDHEGDRVNHLIPQAHEANE